MAGPSPLEGTSASDTPVAAERRIVSVLFADLVGFTRLSERLDAEDVAAIQDACFAAARETIARHGGTLEKFIGDAVMAVFGLERTREDDAERAVRAGLALLSAVERLSAALPMDEVDLRLRVGVNTGEVVVTVAGPDQGRATGDVVNTAARLQAAARPGSLLMGEATALAVAHVVEPGEEHPLELKGKARTVRAVEARGMRSEASREHALGRLRAPMLGREEELGWLSGQVAGTPEGSGRLILLQAPPGVGKSRFAAAVMNAALAEGWVGHAWSARLTASSGPLAALVDLARAAGVLEEADVLARLAAAGTLAAARMPFVADALLGLVDPTRSGRQQDPAVQAAAWLDGFDALAAPRGALWLVEDVHWADEDTLAFLVEAAARPVAGGARRLVLATTRPGYAARWDPCGRANVACRDLPPLTPGTTHQLVHALVGDALPVDVVEQLAVRADGNPLFVEETLRTWVAAGVLVPLGDGWHLSVPAAGVTLPPTIQAAYAAQIDDLPTRERLTVRHGSVAGRRLPAASLPVLEVAAPEMALQTLSQQGMLSGPEPGGLGDTFTYRHALLHDAAYASLARGLRSRLHARLAGWLETVAADRVEEVAAAIGRHYAAALEAAPAMAATIDEGLDREAVRQRAASWLERGAEQARAMCAFGAARELLEQSLALTAGNETRDRARRLAFLGQATARSGRLDEALATLSEAVTVYRELLEADATTAIEGDERAAAREGMSLAAFELAHAHFEQVRFVEGRRVALEALAVIGPGPARVPDVPSARLEYMAAECDHAETDADRSEALERVLRVVEATGHERLALEITHSLAVMRVEVSGREPDWSAIADMARRLGDSETLLDVLGNAALTRACDEPALALPLYDEMEELATSLDLAEHLAWAAYGRTEALLAVGAWDEALRQGLHGLEIAGQHAYRRAALRILHLVVPMSVMRGATDQALRMKAFYETHEGAFPDSPYAHIMRPAMDLYVADAGLIERRLPDPALTLASFEAPFSSPSWLLAMERVVRAWLEEGLVEVVATALGRLGGRGDTQRRLARASHALKGAWLAEANGEIDAIEIQARGSLRDSRAIPAPWWTGRALALLVRCARATPAEAEEVSAIATALGVEPAAMGRW